MNLEALGKRIRARRERRGLKQTDLAAALRVTPQAVSKWERGENAPDISVLVPLSRLLDVSVEWLLGGAPAERETFDAVVFVTGVGDFAARADALTPAAVAAWMNGMFVTLTEVVRRHDGVPVKYVGDGFLAFFTGAEMASRAVRAALEARAVVAEPDLAIALSAGPIYLGSIGHPDYATPDILGATVNTAFMMLSAGGLVVDGALAAIAIVGVRFQPRDDGHYTPEETTP